MDSIFFDSPLDDDSRRSQLYDGQLFVFSPRPSTLALCAFARELTEAAFAPYDPRLAQYHMPVEQYVAVLARLKPLFINHPRAKQLIQDMLREFGCDLGRTYFDVPRLRTMVHGDYLRAGLAYQFHPHRDTWFAAPFCQLNWWLPVYEIQPDNAMAFHPRYWSTPVRNSSSDYNYDVWNREGRQLAAQQIKAETRKQPHAEDEIEPQPQCRLICDVGGTIIFSAAQLHSTVDNTSGRTRFSIDFRTVHFDDVAAQRGAPNVDSASTGTNLRDFLRGTDCTRLPEDVVAPYDKPLVAA
jgi:hypothetical protein